MRRVYSSQSPVLARLARSQTVPAGQPSVALQAMLMPPSGVANIFPPGSRYAATGTTTMPLPSSDPSDPTAVRTLVYLRRRLAPMPATLGTYATYTVVEGQRLDNIAAQYFNDPLQFWQICDANAALRPWDLTGKPGEQLRIPYPAGVPAPQSGS